MSLTYSKFLTIVNPVQHSSILPHSGSKMCMVVQPYGDYSVYYYMEFAMNMNKLQLVEDFLVQLLQAQK